MPSCAAVAVRHSMSSGVCRFSGTTRPRILLGSSRSPPTRGPTMSTLTCEDVERLEGLLQRYQDAADRSQFLATCRDQFSQHAPWFSHRYAEHSAFYSLSKNIDFADRDVLDVGAGTGDHTWRLVQAGGRVTAFEYNPVLIRRGRSVVPEARWIGGLAHVLPFGSETFDIVCCNAALHHMRDVPDAMHEMLRVLRPGGWLLTTGDPFRADASGGETELEVFDNHPDVLLGVNGFIPPFGELVQALVSNRNRINVRFLTSSLSEVRTRRLPTPSRRHNPLECRRVVLSEEEAPLRGERQPLDQGACAEIASLAGKDTGADCPARWRLRACPRRVRRRARNSGSSPSELLRGLRVSRWSDKRSSSSSTGGRSRSPAVTFAVHTGGRAGFLPGRITLAYIAVPRESSWPPVLSRARFGFG